METLREMALPPGFGFHPTDAELIHYLKKKVLGQKIEYEVISEVDIYRHEPWDLPGKCNVPTKDTKWHFFASRDKKYPNGSRANRATVAGYWKSTGKDRTIKVKKRIIGTKKTLVFHEGRPPSGKRTEWIMHEYYIDEKECQPHPEMKDAFVLCRVTKRDGCTSENDNEVDTSNPLPQPPNDAATSVISELETPNDDELQQLLAELIDPACTPSNPVSADPSQDEQNAESANLQDLAVVALKVEPEDASFNQNVPDDTEYLLPEDIYYILCPGNDEFSASIFHDPAEQAALALANQPRSMMEMDPFALPINLADETQKEELQLHQEYNDTSLSNGHINDTGIIVRRREVPSTTSIASVRRVKLQVGINKMVMSNSESINQTVKFVDNSSHLDLIPSGGTSAEQSDAANSGKDHGSAPKGENGVVMKSSARAENSRELCDIADKTSCVQGFLRGLVMVLRGCSSVGLNFLFLTACMIGAAAVILYFVLHDVRRHLGIGL